MTTRTEWRVGYAHRGPSPTWRTRETAQNWLDAALSWGNLTLGVDVWLESRTVTVGEWGPVT